MRFSLLGLWLVAFPLLAVANPVSFRNDREGESFYSNNSNTRAIERALRDIDQSTILRAFDETLETQTASKLCSYEINTTFLKKLREYNPKFDELPGALYFLRAQDEMDDVVTGMLLDANKVKTTQVYLKSDEERPFIPAKKILNQALPMVANFDKKYAKNACFDEAYRQLVGDVLKLDKSLKASTLEGIFYKALKDKKISNATYVALEQARQNEVEAGGLSIKTYYQKLSSLRLQYPLRDRTERSTFVTQKADKMKMSNRQRLMDTYSDIQIMMMGNIIKKLRTRLESQKVEILIYDRSQGTETITLEPMERFRLAIKLLRKEMALLALNTYFGGRTPSYLDLMTAAYEVGIIPASELEELAGLQDIWNPQKTFWEKAKVWVQTLSTVATIVIPPPYGFIPALALVVIEATTEKSKDPNQMDPTSLF